MTIRKPALSTPPWTCVCGHVNSGFASACYGGCGKDRDRTERDFVTHGKPPLPTQAEREREAVLSAIYALRRAKDEATHGVTANARFIDQEVLVALGELERAFLPAEGTPLA